MLRTSFQVESPVLRGHPSPTAGLCPVSVAVHREKARAWLRGPSGHMEACHPLPLHPPHCTEAPGAGAALVPGGRLIRTGAPAGALLLGLFPVDPPPPGQACVQCPPCPADGSRGASWGLWAPARTARYPGRGRSLLGALWGGPGVLLCGTAAQCKHRGAGHSPGPCDPSSPAHCPPVCVLSVSPFPVGPRPPVFTGPSPAASLSSVPSPPLGAFLSSFPHPKRASCVNDTPGHLPLEQPP